MHVLSFETANFSCSACVTAYSGEGSTEILSSRVCAGNHVQGRRLIPLLQEVVREAGLDSLKDVDAFAVATGPGSFTGVRIGLAAAIGLKVATGLPVIGVNSFEAAAFSVLDENQAQLPLMVVLESGRAELFMQVFSPDLQPLREPVNISAGMLDDYWTGEALLTGNGARSIITMQQHAGMKTGTLKLAERTMFDASDVGRRAVLIMVNKKEREYFLNPFYVRPPDISAGKKT